MNTKNFQPIVRSIIILLIIVSLYLISYYFIKYIYPFIIAFFIASLLHPIVSHFEIRWRMRRIVVTSFIMLLFLVCTILISFLALQQLLNEMSTLTSMLPTTYKTVNQLLTDLGNKYFLPLYQFIKTIFPTIPSSATWDINQLTTFVTDKLFQSSMTITQRLFSSITILITSVSQMMFIIIFITISGFIMTKDYVILQHYYRRKIPRRFQVFLTKIHVQLKKSTLGMIKAHFLLALWTSVVAMICLFIFRLEHILFITILIFLIDLIPYVGIGLIFIPWILYQFMNGEYLQTIQLTSLYIIIIVLRQFIEPKIIATHIGLHPLVTVILLFFAINMFGILGVVITPIMLIAVSAIYHTQLIPTIWQYIIEEK